MKKVLLILLVIAVYLSSCNTSREGCAGNKAMLTAGAGKTKFNK